METMSNKDIATKLAKLVQLDIDAVAAYEQALKNIDIMEIYNNINQFCEDHRRHITELSAIINRLGEEPPEYSQDFKGFLIEGFTAIRSMTGVEGALKAMQGNEKLTNSTYEDALSWDMPMDIKAVIERNRADERRHLTYIESVLATQPWKAKAATV